MSSNCTESSADILDEFLECVGNLVPRISFPLPFLPNRIVLSLSLSRDKTNHLVPRCCNVSIAKILLQNRIEYHLDFERSNGRKIKNFRDHSSSSPSIPIHSISCASRSVNDSLKLRNPNYQIRSSIYIRENILVSTRKKELVFVQTYPETFHLTTCFINFSLGNEIKITSSPPFGAIQL